MQGRSVHPSQLEDDELEAQLDVERTRASGPGGQHRNRTETAIRLVHTPTGIKAAASERRSQHENFRMAMKRMRLNLALQYRTPLEDSDFVAPGEYQPSAIWKMRVKNSRIRVNVEHSDFPALLAEVLDRLHVDEDDLSRTATAFGVSTSQLVRFLKLEPAALAQLNERRRKRGYKPLR